MKITKVSDGEIILEAEGIEARRIYSTTEFEAIHIALDPGSRIDTHKNDVDVCFYILEGEALVEIGDVRKEALRDCIIECLRGVPRALENSSKNKILRVMVLKTL